jgi:hypothetical protein
MQPGKMDSIVASVMGTSQVRDALPESTNSSSPWRRTGVRYATNELYLDLHERLDVIVDGRNGVLQHSEVRCRRDASPTDTPASQVPPTGKVAGRAARRRLARRAGGRAAVLWHAWLLRG